MFDCLLKQKFKKVFVPAPANVVTGGAELLHQLVDVINQLGGDAYIVYSDAKAQVPTDYAKYNLKIASKIEDVDDAVVVFNEGDFSVISEVRHAKVLLWWLSVDNFFYCNKKKLGIIDLWQFSRRMGLGQIWRRLKKLFKVKTFTISDLKRNGNVVLCAYQSEYARQFLIRNGFKALFPLGDYINSEYLESYKNELKENAIAYNPKKGYEFTRRLIAVAPELDWRPIMGLSRDGVVELLKKCKVYIDFGNHPGKDRLPREAALCRCAILTGTRGSAKYYEDVPIPDKYKSNQYAISPVAVVEKIKWLLSEYENCIDEYEDYRNVIKAEKMSFVAQVKSIFFK